MIVYASLLQTAEIETLNETWLWYDERKMINVQSSFIAKIELSTIGYLRSISAIRQNTFIVNFLNICNWGIFYFPISATSLFSPCMSVNCNECGSTTVWDDDVGSAVCTSCGSLTDPSQSVLTSGHYNDNDIAYSSLWDPSTSKTLRGRYNWDLAGQGKESRDRKNMVNILLTLTIVTLYGFKLVYYNGIYQVSRVVIQCPRSFRTNDYLV